MLGAPEKVAYNFKTLDTALKEQFRLVMGICTRRKSRICQGALELKRMIYS